MQTHLEPCNWTFWSLQNPQGPLFYGEALGQEFSYTDGSEGACLWDLFPLGGITTLFGNSGLDFLPLILSTAWTPVTSGSLHCCGQRAGGNMGEFCVHLH